MARFRFVTKKLEPMGSANLAQIAGAGFGLAPKETSDPGAWDCSNVKTYMKST